jgi:hypothetical protein
MPTREEAPHLFEGTGPAEPTTEELEALDAHGWDYHRHGDTHVALRRAGTAREEQSAATFEGLLQAVRETEARRAALAESPPATSPEPSVVTAERQ